MNDLKDFKKLIEKEIEKLETSIKHEKQIRDSSPSAVESHHDTTRNQTEKLVSALEGQLENLKKQVLLIPSEPPKGNTLSLWKGADIQIGANSMSVIIVPEGLGGYKLKSRQTLSINSPLGKTIMSKKEGDSFTINSQKGKIIKIL